MYLFQCDRYVRLDHFDLEQDVKSFEHPHLNEVVASSERLQQSQTFLQDQLQTSVLFLVCPTT